jgi:hypothetical protein
VLAGCLRVICHTYHPIRPNDQTAISLDSTLKAAISVNGCTARVSQEEIFGPVLSVIAFDDEQDALRIGRRRQNGATRRITSRDFSGYGGCRMNPTQKIPSR